MAPEPAVSDSALAMRSTWHWRGLRLLAGVLAFAVLAGVALDVLTFLVARYGPQGGDAASWSFRGNGALVVPFGLGPAVLAGTWAALVLHARGAARWLWGGVLAGLFGGALVCVSIFILVGFGSAAQQISDLIVIPTWLSMLVAPLVAALFPLHSARRSARRGAVQLVSALLFPIALIGAFFAAATLLAPGS